MLKFRKKKVNNNNNNNNSSTCIESQIFKCTTDLP